MSFSIFNSFNGNSCKLGQNYSIVSRDIDPPTTVTYISADSSSVTFSFTAPTTSGTILSYTPYINGSVASGSGTPSSYTINGLTSGTQYTINMVANIAANITATTTTTSSLSPTSITGCTLWLDAADSSSLVLSGSNVTQWNDKSNGGYNFTSASGHYPVYSTNNISITGPASANSANYQYLINTTIPFTTNYSIFCVGNINASHPTLYNFNVLIKAATTTNGQLVFGTDASGNFSSVVGSGTSVNSATNNNTPLISVFSRSIMELTNDGTTTGSLPYINGTVMDARNGTATSFTGLTIGDTFWAGGSNNWNGNVNEILIYNSVLSTADRKKVEGYLAWKWGIQTSLPSNHTYYSAAPSTTTTTLGIVQNVKSNPSVPVALYTLDTFPTNLQFISATSNSVTLKFNPPIGTVIGYTPYVNGSVATGSGDQSSYTISGLTTGTTYSIAIAANFYLDTSSSLVQYYRFEQSDVSGTKLLNYATKSYDASFVNGSTIISTTGNYKVGSSALNLISDHNYTTSPYVTLPSINITTNGLSFSLWFRSNCNAPIGTAPHIFDYGNGSNSDNIFMFIYPANTTTGNLGFEVYSNSTNSNGFSYYPITSINDNVWRHVVWTLTYSTTKNSTWNIYLNGSFVSTTTGYYPRNISRSGNYIGKSLWTADEMFNGQVDDFRVYNTVLSASDAAQLYAYNPNFFKSSSVSMTTTN